MITGHQKYCLDANVLIQAWQKYYFPKLCLDYWIVLDELGKQDIIFVPKMVYDEITRTDDDLSKWLKKSNIPIAEIDENVTSFLKIIFAANPTHLNLVDNTKNRSLADPWVIAHAINVNAIVVTKEEKVTAINTSKIKIPNVFDNMGVPWINDFQLIDKLNILFSCKLISSET
jgi:predicted nucleic acid-binding protein